MKKKETKMEENIIEVRKYNDNAHGVVFAGTPNDLQYAFMHIVIALKNKLGLSEDDIIKTVKASTGEHCDAILDAEA